LQNDFEGNNCFKEINFVVGDIAKVIPNMPLSIFRNKSIDFTE